MDQIRINQRKKTMSLLASIAMPGLGHIYNGELVKGLCFFALFIMTPLILLRITVYLPDNLLLSGAAFSFVATVVIYVLVVGSAVKTSKKYADAYQLKSYNRWYFYIVIWLLCVLLIGGNTLTYSQSHILQFCRITSGSMQPTLEPGDFIIVDRTVYDRISPAVGDIILFVNPDNRKQLFLKRIDALPGDTLVQQNMLPFIVPHGQVYVLGDNRQHAIDSRNFGTVPLKEIVGKARQVYLSVGERGIRWNRIGLVL